MTIFYRYIRPLKLNEKRLELQTLPYGGICLRLESLEEGDLFFTYARCHPKEFFNKDVARTIADERAGHALSDVRIMQQLRGIPNTQNTILLVESIIVRCGMMDVSHEHSIVQRYMHAEYSKFASALQNLFNNNQKEKLRAVAWQKGLQDVSWAIYQGLRQCTTE
jgi:hypothetical protein